MFKRASPYIYSGTEILLFPFEKSLIPAFFAISNAFVKFST